MSEPTQRSNEPKGIRLRSKSAQSDLPHSLRRELQIIDEQRKIAEQTVNWRAAADFDSVAKIARTAEETTKFISRGFSSSLCSWPESLVRLQESGFARFVMPLNYETVFGRLIANFGTLAWAKLAAPSVYWPGISAEPVCPQLDSYPYSAQTSIQRPKERYIPDVNRSRDQEIHTLCYLGIPPRGRQDRRLPENSSRTSSSRGSSVESKSKARGGLAGPFFTDLGDVFEIEFEGKVRQLKKSAGLTRIRILVDNPDVPLPASALRALEVGENLDNVPDLVALGDDPSEKKRLVCQAESLEQDIHDAKELGDIATVQLMTTEREYVVERIREIGVRYSQLAVDNPEINRARKAVGKSISESYKVLRKKFPELEIYLRTTIRTGFRCTYSSHLTRE